jgi:hypothetical protein
MKQLLSPGQSCAVLHVPMQHPLSFVMTIVRKTDGPRVVLVINKAVTDPAHPHASHPVIQWLARPSVGSDGDLEGSYLARTRT